MTSVTCNSKQNLIAPLLSLSLSRHHETHPKHHEISLSLSPPITGHAISDQKLPPLATTSTHILYLEVYSTLLLY